MAKFMDVHSGFVGVTAQQLIRNASLYVLENRLRQAGKDPAGLWRVPHHWPDYGTELDTWIEETAGSLAILAASAMSIIDFEAIVIEGAFPASIRARLTAAAAAKLQQLDLQGLTPAHAWPPSTCGSSSSRRSTASG